MGLLLATANDGPRNGPCINYVHIAREEGTNTMEQLRSVQHANNAKGGRSLQRKNLGIRLCMSLMESNLGHTSQSCLISFDGLKWPIIE